MGLMARNFLVGAAVGSGVVARAAEDGGADFLLALNAGRLRSMGAPSIACMLPISNAGQITLSFAEGEVLPQAKLPVYLGITSWAGEPHDEDQAERLVELGFAGAVNFPSCMHMPAAMRRQLDRVNLGVRRELSLLRMVQARGAKGLFYCGNKADARMAAEADIDGIVFNFGWNVGGMRGHRSTITLEEAALIARDVARLVRGLSKHTQVFLEGGPILTADDLSYVVRHADIDGYVGGSTIDRFPVQYSVVNQIAAYKLAAVRPGDQEREVQAALTDLARFGLVGETPAFTSFAVQLLRAAGNRSPILLTGEPGSDLSSAVDALLSLAGAAVRQRAKFFDFAENLSPHRMNEILFGRRSGERTAPGLLTGDEGDAVVLMSCQAMPRLVARRLKTALRDGRAHPVGSRAPVRLAGRLLFVSETATDSPVDDVSGAAVRLTFPPMRDRHGDIKLILERKLDEIGLDVSQRAFIRPAAYRVLMAHRWRRNDAELKGLAVALARFAPATPIEAHVMRDLLEGHAPEQGGDDLDELTRQQIVQALVQNGFHRGATARMLGMSRKTLYNRMRRLGLN
jgi:predicted TIM-barrel enzyme